MREAHSSAQQAVGNALHEGHEEINRAQFFFRGGDAQAAGAADQIVEIRRRSFPGALR